MDEHTPRPGDAGIVVTGGGGTSVSAHDHGAELQHAERPSAPADPRRTVERRTACFQPDHGPDQQHHRREEHVLAYYSYFGLASFLPSLIGLWVLDVALLVYHRIDDVLLPACVAAVSVSCLGFVFSEYTTVWLGGGFGVVLLLGWLLSRRGPLIPTVSS